MRKLSVGTLVLLLALCASFSPAHASIFMAFAVEPCGDGFFIVEASPGPDPQMSYSYSWTVTSGGLQIAGATSGPIAQVACLSTYRGQTGILAVTVTSSQNETLTGYLPIHCPGTGGLI